jgi:multidrug efflux system membrane fusion protein
MNCDAAAERRTLSGNRKIGKRERATRAAVGCGPPLQSGIWNGGSRAGRRTRARFSISPFLRGLAVSLVVLLSTSCSKSEPTLAPKAGRAYRVSTTTVTARPMTYSVDAIGSLEALQVVVVPARVEGALDRLDFDVGSVVATDTTLAVVDERRYSLVVLLAKAAVAESESAAKQAEAAVASAAARTARAKAQLDDAEADLARWKALQAKNAGFVTEEKILSMEATAKSLRAGLDEMIAGEGEAAARVHETTAAIESRRAAVAIATKNVEDTRVRPSIAGIVEKRHVSAGQYVKVGDPVATLVDVSKLRLRFTVGESESVQLKIGQTVSFRVKAFGDREFKAELFHVDAVADPTTRMVECLATVAEPGSGLRPGFFAEVSVPAAHAGDSIVVPEGSLLSTETGFVAFVVVGGKAARRPVKIGLHTKSGQIEILEGLKTDEVLVVNGAQSLQDGVPVEVADEAKKS